MLRDLLEREGFAVIEARDGVQALDEIDRHAPDALVLDLNLPRLDGYQVLSHMRARTATATIPVLVLTARGDEDSEVKVFESGANDFITKPFRPRALSARLKALLRSPAKTMPGQPPGPRRHDAKHRAVSVVIDADIDRAAMEPRTACRVTSSCDARQERAAPAPGRSCMVASSLTSVPKTPRSARCARKPA